MLNRVPDAGGSHDPTALCRLRQGESYATTQFRQDLGLEPGISPHPAVRSPGRMRKRERRRQMLRVPTHAVGHPPGPEHVFLRVGAHQQREAEAREPIEKGSSPQRSTLTPRRRIPAARAATGIAQRHRHDRHTGGVVEEILGHAHPSPKLITGGIGEGYAALVRPRSWSLARYEKRSRRRDLQYRSRSQRQVGARGTRTHPFDQVLQSVSCTARFHSVRDVGSLNLVRYLQNSGMCPIPAARSPGIGGLIIEPA